MKIAIAIMSIFLLFSPSIVNAYSIVDVPENRIIDVPEYRIIDVPENRIIDVPEYRIIDVPENRTIDVPELRIIDVDTNHIIDVDTIRIIDIPDNRIILTNNQSIDLSSLGIIDIDTNNPNQNIVTFLEFVSGGSIPISTPEPATMLLLGLGLIGLAGVRRKFKK